MPKQIRCPNCNKRLLDVERDSTGLIAIKCPKCKQVFQIDLNALNIK